MQVVIPYRSEPLNGTELRYCLRSMEKNFVDITDVLVIGDKPGWYTGPHLQADQLPIKGQREIQIISKLLLADGVVMYCPDDVYALVPFDSNIPQYYHKTCKYMTAKAGERRYREMYKRCPGHWLNFDIHQPMVIDVEKYRDLDISEDRPIKTLYANSYPGKQVELADGKIRGRMSYEQICKHIQGKLFFSSNGESNVNNDFIRVLEGLYPLPSKYES